MNGEFEDILQRKLRDFEIEPAAKDWAIIERRIGAPAKKSIPLKRYIAVAASIAIVAVCGYQLMKNDSFAPAQQQAVTEIPSGVLPPAHSGTDPDYFNPAIKAVAELKTAIDQANSAKAAAAMNELAILEQTESNPSVIADNSYQPETGTQEKNTAAAPQQERRGTSQSYAQNNSSQRRYNNSFDNEQLKKGKQNKWSLGVYGNTGAGNSNSNPGGFQRMMNSPAKDYISTTLYTMSMEQPQMKHRLPLTFGLTVRKSLSKRWGIETGLTYSYLTSKAELDATFRYEKKQQLHYLGVPVALTFTAYRTKNFEIYGRAGGAMDFNIGAKVTSKIIGSDNRITTDTEKFTAKGIQWSTSANVGVMYNISPVVGFYFEPGVSYYFKNSQQPDSYWKENPTNFNMKLGVRTTF